MQEYTKKTHIKISQNMLNELKAELKRELKKELLETLFQASGGKKSYGLYSSGNFISMFREELQRTQEEFAKYYIYKKLARDVEILKTKMLDELSFRSDNLIRGKFEKLILIFNKM